MTILRPALTPQTITIIPRYTVPYITVILLNEETQVLNQYEIEDLVYLNGYLTIRFDFECLEGQSFNLEIKDGDTVLFRGKAFATDETDLENYKLSKNLLQ